MVKKKKAARKGASKVTKVKEDGYAKLLGIAIAKLSKIEKHLAALVEREKEEEEFEVEPMQCREIEIEGETDAD